MYQLSKILMVSIITSLCLVFGHTQVVFDQSVTIEDELLNLVNTPIWFYDDSSNLRSALYLDFEDDFWINSTLEIKEKSKHMHVHSDTLYLEGKGQILSDPDQASSDLELRSNRYVIAHVDANQPNFSGEAENGRFIVKGGDGHESLWVTESGGLIVWQQTDPNWAGFGQSTTNSSAGIDIVPQSGARAELYSDDSDLCFAFNNLDRSYIDDQTGKYFNASNAGSGGAIVSTTNKSADNVLKKVMAIPLQKATQKSAFHDLELDAKKLSQLFPKTVQQKAGEYAVAYADFGLIAIKAIQEQQVLIEQLQAEIKALKESK